MEVKPGTPLGAAFLLEVSSGHPLAQELPDHHVSYSGRATVTALTATFLTFSGVFSTFILSSDFMLQFLVM